MEIGAEPDKSGKLELRVLYRDSDTPDELDASWVGEMGYFSWRRECGMALERVGRKIGANQKVQKKDIEELLS